MNARTYALSIFITLLCLLNVACSDDTLPKYVELRSLRVLALQAGTDGGPSEYSPGDTVTITPYVSDYAGGARALTYEAVACLDPGIVVGAEPSCAGSSSAVSLANGTATIPATGGTGSTTAFNLTVPATILTGRSASDRYNGISYLVTYSLSANSQETVRAFKRLIVSESTKTTKNLNPQTSDLLANGASLTALPTAEVNLSTSFPTSSVETYDVMASDLSTTNRAEELLTTWFITDGEVEFYRTINASTTKYTPPSAAPSGRNPLVVGVTRDNRGGVTVIVREL